eukprot:CAMPEP_0185034172 /NCGR_PEP_ID=MMETSP1103-20130426/23800_1 /TAXON_ID=36769 /ORGANISM="Paraphysomonas bandaiensis, Strain Caron Lab Isolate" /LENGTH=415 /DNA_ID=CAMNT_0027570717 /DNA_START=420 /DNA_END=1667 /DNA_ORIENTATION=-
MIVIAFSCTSYVLSSDPGFRNKPSSCDDPVCDNDPELCPNTIMCEPVEEPIFELFETICISIFTVDYVIRILTVPLMPSRLANILPADWDTLDNPLGTKPDPTYSWYTQLLKYASTIMNIIDLVAILPYYIGFATDSGGSVSIVRILRLARVLRIFKIGSFTSGMNLIAGAVRNSIPAMSILLFCTILGIILFGSIIYFLEAGTYVVNKDFPDGAYVRWNFDHTAKENSPFTSILVSCYWAVVTSTTVGYGDIHPTSPMGRFLAVILMYAGILLLALPISVVGAAFTREYEKYHSKSAENADDRSSVATFKRNAEPPIHDTRIPANDTAFIKYREREDMLRALSEMSCQLTDMTTRVNAMMLVLTRDHEEVVTEEKFEGSGKRVNFTRMNSNGHPRMVSEGVELVPGENISGPQG